MLFVFAAPTLVLAPPDEEVGVAGLLIAAAFAFYALFEYGVEMPALIDFRSSPPFNRLRFALTAAVLASVSLCVGAGPGAPLLHGICDGFVAFLNFPNSPSTMAAEIFTRASAFVPDQQVERAAATAFCVAGALTALLCAWIWFSNWPGPMEDFNILVNLPTWDPGEPGEDSGRLVFLGVQVLVTAVAMIFAMLVAAAFVAQLTDPEILASPLAQVWAATIWAATPAVLIVRGVAVLKLARLRRRAARPV